MPTSRWASRPSSCARSRKRRPRSRPSVCRRSSSSASRPRSAASSWSPASPARASPPRCPACRHGQIRQRLAETIAAVMSLRLLPRKSGRGMVPACELLLSTPRVRDLLYEGQVSELSRVVEAGHEEGLISFNYSLRMLVQQDVIELETALSASDRPEELLLALRGFSKGKANQTGAAQSGRLRLAGGE